MTDRVNALFVVLEKDIREDDVASLLEAIKQFRGVLDVTTNVADPTSALAEMRAKADLREKMYRVFFEKPS